MKKQELIEIAKRCVSGTCYKCPFAECKQKPNNDCRGNMINALTEKLEKTRLIISVGAGENYETMPVSESDWNRIRNE